MKNIRTVLKVFNVKGTRIPAHVKQLFVNGHEKFDAKLENEASRKVFSIYREKFGIISSSKIKQLRERYSISQKDFATILGINTLTLAVYEVGALPDKFDNRKLLSLYKHPYLISSLLTPKITSKLSRLGLKNLKKFLHKDTNSQSSDFTKALILNKYRKINGSEYTGYCLFSFEKFYNMVLYFVNRIIKLSPTKLNKLMYYADFSYFAKQAVSISGTSYAKLPHGPVPDEYKDMYHLMNKEGLLTKEFFIFNGCKCQYYKATMDYDPNLFNKDELSQLKSIKNKFQTYNASRISEVSHKEAGWKNTPKSQLISYKYAVGLK